MHHNIPGRRVVLWTPFDGRLSVCCSGRLVETIALDRGLSISGSNGVTFVLFFVSTDPVTEGGDDSPVPPKGIWSSGSVSASFCSSTCRFRIFKIAFSCSSDPELYWNWNVITWTFLPRRYVGPFLLDGNQAIQATALFTTIMLKLLLGYTK